MVRDPDLDRGNRLGHLVWLTVALGATLVVCAAGMVAALLSGSWHIEE
jgi:hypothetical protein